MKNILFLFISSSIINWAIAQEEKKSFDNFGIEEGAGYNILKYSGFEKQDLIWIQPSIKLYYSFNIHQISDSKKLKILFFLGYYTFGGASKMLIFFPEDSTDKSIIAFQSFEGGINPCYEIKNFQIGLLLKGQQIFSAKNKIFYRGFTETIQTIDVSNEFKKYAMNTGIKFRCKIKKFSISTEFWYGITNLNSHFSYYPRNSIIRENNYRLLLGYEF